MCVHKERVSDGVATRIVFSQLDGPFLLFSFSSTDKRFKIKVFYCWILFLLIKCTVLPQIYLRWHTGGSQMLDSMLWNSKHHSVASGQVGLGIPCRFHQTIKYILWATGLEGTFGMALAAENYLRRALVSPWISFTTVSVILWFTYTMVWKPLSNTGMSCDQI